MSLEDANKLFFIMRPVPFAAKRFGLCCNEPGQWMIDSYGTKPHPIDVETAADLHVGNMHRWLINHPKVFHFNCGTDKPGSDYAIQILPNYNEVSGPVGKRRWEAKTLVEVYALACTEVGGWL